MLKREKKVIKSQQLESAKGEPFRFILSAAAKNGKFETTERPEIEYNVMILVM